MGRWKPKPAQRPGSGRFTQKQRRLADLGAVTAGVFGEELVTKATRHDIVQNADIVEELLDPARERLGWPMDPEVNRMLASLVVGAWNISRLKGDAKAEGRADLAEACQGWPELSLILLDMLEQADGMYPDDPRVLVNVSLQFKGTTMYISAASMGTP